MSWFQNISIVCIVTILNLTNLIPRPTPVCISFRKICVHLQHFFIIELATLKKQEWFNLLFKLWLSYSFSATKLPAATGLPIYIAIYTITTVHCTSIISVLFLLLPLKCALYFIKSVFIYNSIEILSWS